MAPSRMYDQTRRAASRTRAPSHMYQQARRDVYIYPHQDRARNRDRFGSIDLYSDSNSDNGPGYRSTWQRCPSRSEPGTKFLRDAIEKRHAYPPRGQPNYQATPRVPHSNSRALSSSVRKTDRRHPKEAYTPGTIFSAPAHGQINAFADETNPNVSITRFGAVYTKFRKYVVISVHENHCQAVPIYTHRGLGLRFVVLKDEHVSLRDRADECPEDVETRHGLLLCERDRGYPANNTFIKGKSSIHLTEMTSHRYGHLATIEGRLEAASLAKLRALLWAINHERLDLWNAFQEMETATEEDSGYGSKEESARSQSGSSQEGEDSEVEEGEILE